MLTKIDEAMQRYIDEAIVPGVSFLILKDTEIIYERHLGFANIESKAPLSADAIFRIASNTKLITSVVLMMLYEQGCFQLDDPVAKYLPEFAATQVWKGPGHGLEDVEPQHSPMLIKHLLTHTSGLTYGFMNTNVVDAAYRAQQLEFPGKAATLAEWVEGLASVPLLCQPGSQWNYSVATDVLGRLVEVWSQQELASFFNEHILSLIHI